MSLNDSNLSSAPLLHRHHTDVTDLETIWPDDLVHDIDDAPGPIVSGRGEDAEEATNKQCFASRMKTACHHGKCKLFRQLSLYITNLSCKLFRQLSLYNCNFSCCSPRKLAGLRHAGYRQFVIWRYGCHGHNARRVHLCRHLVLRLNQGYWAEMLAQDAGLNMAGLHHAGYGQFVVWRYGCLWRDVRRVLPSCIISHHLPLDQLPQPHWRLHGLPAGSHLV